MKITQEEWNAVIKKVEENHCFRYTAGTDANTAFMVPVAKDNKTVIGPCQEFTWKQLKALAELKHP